MVCSFVEPRDLAPGTSVQLKIPKIPTYHLQEGRIVRKRKKEFYDVNLLNNEKVRFHETRLIILKESRVTKPSFCYDFVFKVKRTDVFPENLQTLCVWGEGVVLCITLKNVF